MARIIVAEDEPMLRQIMKTSLEGEGHFVITVSNGRLAEEVIIDNQDFDLLISDIIMPELDGRELVTKIRKQDHIKDLPVILISGFVPFNDIVEILKLGTTRFLPKPIKNRDLIDTVNNCLEEQADKQKK